MTTATRTSVPRLSRYQGKSMTFDKFVQWEPQLNGLKYEWNNGIIEVDYAVKIEVRYILDNIIRKFVQTASFQDGNSLMAEADCTFTSLGTLRRPDACYLTKEQIRNPQQAPEAPAFVIELVSPSNRGGSMEKKMTEYFKAGSQVVWHIFPEIEQVWVFTSPKTVKICTDQDSCSAAPAVPELELTVDEIFKK